MGTAPLELPHTLLLLLSDAFAGCLSFSRTQYPLPGEIIQVTERKGHRLQKEWELILHYSEVKGGGDTFVKSLISGRCFYTS